MAHRQIPGTASASPSRIGIRIVTLGLLAAAGLSLSACNTTAGAGRDVSATGAAISRGANDVKNGL